MKWQEVEAENGRLINDILEKQGMQQDGSKTFIMFLDDNKNKNNVFFYFK